MARSTGAAEPKLSERSRVRIVINHHGQPRCSGNLVRHAYVLPLEPGNIDRTPFARVNQTWKTHAHTFYRTFAFAIYLSHLFEHARDGALVRRVCCKLCSFEHATRQIAGRDVG